MKVFTVGYGGRNPADFAALLARHGVQTLVDVRLRPDRASMGAYVRAKNPEKGIECLLATAGIRYHSFIELGNVFLDFPDWQSRYERLLRASGDLLLERVLALSGPVCLMCAEKRASECHRAMIAEQLADLGHEVEHLE